MLIGDWDFIPRSHKVEEDSISFNSQSLQIYIPPRDFVLRMPVFILHICMSCDLYVFLSLALD